MLGDVLEVSVALWVGSVSAVALGTAVERGGTTTAALGVCSATASVTPVWS